MNWIILIAATLLLSACGSPQDYAEAERIKEQARVEADRATIANDAERIRQETLAPVAAELEVARLRATQNLQTREQLAALELKYKTLEGDLQVATQQRIDKLEASHQKVLADLQAATDQSRAGAIAVVVIFIALSIGITMLLTQAGYGIGLLFRLKGRNLGEVIYPRPGAIIARPEGLYLPGRIPGSFQIIHKPGLIERVARVAGYLIAVKRGEHPDLPSFAPWVQTPRPDQVMPEVVGRDQATAMLAEAVRGDTEKTIQRAAVDGVRSGVQSVFAASGAPGAFIIERDDDPERLARVEQAFLEAGEE